MLCVLRVLKEEKEEEKERERREREREREREKAKEAFVDFDEQKRGSLVARSPFLNLDPFTTTKQALLQLEYPDKLQRLLLTPQREVLVELVITRDNGEIEVKVFFPSSYFPSFLSTSRERERERERDASERTKKTKKSKKSKTDLQRLQGAARRLPRALQRRAEVPPSGEKKEREN